MTRKWLEPVKDWTAYKEKRFYCVLVASVDRAGSELRVGLEHLEADQAGRVHECPLPLPIRPGGITADFFKACDINVTPGTKIAPRDAIGTQIQVRLAQDRSGVWMPVAFRITQEESADAQ